jgi:hypothetical protein
MSKKLPASAFKFLLSIMTPQPFIVGCKASANGLKLRSDAGLKCLKSGSKRLRKNLRLLNLFAARGGRLEPQRWVSGSIGEAEARLISDDGCLRLAKLCFQSFPRFAIVSVITIAICTLRQRRRSTGLSSTFVLK